MKVEKTEMDAVLESILQTVRTQQKALYLELLELYFKDFPAIDRDFLEMAFYLPMESLISDYAKGFITFRAWKVITQTLSTASARNSLPKGARGTTGLSTKPEAWRKKAKQFNNLTALELTNKLETHPV